MKITLQNFRCYENKTFDFGDKGLVLLSGSSGVGKTSILLAIQFVLYGAGTKLVTFGKTSCSVSLEYEEFCITRTKRPNRLIITGKENFELEDEVAQEFIERKFGIAFDIISYLSQNTYNSFVLMSPLDKLAFLEKVSFNGLDIQKLKAKCQAEIKKRNEELISATSQLETVEKHFQEVKKPALKKFPVKTLDKEKFIKNETIKCKNSKILLKRAQISYEKFRQELEDLVLYQAKISGISKNLEGLENNLKDVTSQELEYAGDEALSVLQEQLKLMIDKKKILSLKETYSNDEKKLSVLEDKERETLKSELSFLKSSLWSKYSKTEVEELLLDYRNIKENLEVLSSLQKDLEKIPEITDTVMDKKILEKSKLDLEDAENKLSKIELQKELYECPSCHSSLKLQDGSLVEYQNINQTEEEPLLLKEEKRLNSFKLSIKNNISKLEKSIPRNELLLEKKKDLEKKIFDINEALKIYEDNFDLTQIKINIDELLDYKKEELGKEVRIKTLTSRLDSRIYSDTIQMLRMDIKKQLLLIQNTEESLKGKVIHLAISEDELKEKITLQKKTKEQNLSIKEKISSLLLSIEKEKKEKEKLTSSYIEKYKEIQEIEFLTKSKDSLSLEISTQQELVIKYEKNLSLIAEYQEYLKQLEIYKKWEVEMKELQELEEKRRKRYSASTILKEKILQAESIAISNIINSINLHVQEYLDIFFPDNPIVVRLLPFKTTKKSVKPQINLEVDYKGNQCDITSLSGGELSRVTLAYTLALSEIFNSPLILLDECTASLDQELTSVVMEGVKDRFPEKLVIVIAHQVVVGDFDRQVCL